MKIRNDPDHIELETCIARTLGFVRASYDAAVSVMLGRLTKVVDSKDLPNL